MSLRVEPKHPLKEISAREKLLLEEWAPKSSARHQASRISTDDGFKQIRPMVNDMQEHANKRMSPLLFEEWKAQALCSEKPGGGSQSHQQGSGKKHISTAHPYQSSFDKTNQPPSTFDKDAMKEGDSKFKGDKKRQSLLKADYVAPNGSRFYKQELTRLSNGVKPENKDRVYFRPSFIEDPWRNLKNIDAPVS